MNYIKVKDHPNLVRDANSNAILNVDEMALNKYRMERDKILNEKNKQKQLEDDLAQTKKDIQEIKNLLIQLMGQK